MPRPLRDDFPGAVQHVFARGNRKQPIFLDEADFRLYLALLGGMVVAKKWRVLAYCLMPNHVHLLVETPEPTLARGMQCLHGMYARLFNDRHRFVGHLFQGRYGSKLVRDDAQLITVLRYIGANPIEAGLANPAGESWPWNSFAAVVADEAPSWLDVDRLFEYVAEWTNDPLQRYHELIAGALPSPA
jgi:REP element-mobilizing transposase RayT